MLRKKSFNTESMTKLPDLTVCNMYVGRPLITAVLTLIKYLFQGQGLRETGETIERVEGRWPVQEEGRVQTEGGSHQEATEKSD